MIAKPLHERSKYKFLNRFCATSTDVFIGDRSLLFDLLLKTLRFFTQRFHTGIYSSLFYEAYFYFKIAYLYLCSLEFVNLTFMFDVIVFKGTVITPLRRL